MAQLPESDCLVVAVATPVTPDLHPDGGRLAQHCRMLQSKGCDGFALFGTTGEGPEFSVADRTSTLEALIGAGIEPGSILVSVSALAMPDIVALTRHALDRNVAGVLLMPPCVYRSGITEDGTFRFFAGAVEGIDRSDLRLFLYHFPDICGAPVTASVIRRLDERYPGLIAGVKDSGGDADFTEALLRSFSHLSIFTGSEAHLPQLLSAGLRGTVCGLGNVMPRLLRELFARRTAFGRRELLPHILGADAILSRRSFVASVKAVIAEAAGDAEWRRVVPPMSEIPMIERQRMIADFQQWESALTPPLRSFGISAPARESKVVPIRSA